MSRSQNTIAYESLPRFSRIRRGRGVSGGGQQRFCLRMREEKYLLPIQVKYISKMFEQCERWPAPSTLEVSDVARFNAQHHCQLALCQGQRLAAPLYYLPQRLF